MDIFLLLRGVAALIFVVSLIGGIGLLAKRFGFAPQARPGKQMQVIESCVLDARHKLLLVRIGEATRAVLIGPNSCEFLNEDIELAALPAQEEAGAAPAPNVPQVIGWQAALQKFAQTHIIAKGETPAKERAAS